MGIYSRTREEWTIGSFECQMNSIIIVTLYDTLGMASIEFILKQTELITILVESKNLGNILKLKLENRLGYVKNIIYMHCNDINENLEEIKDKLKNLGLNLISYETIIATGKKCLEEKDNEILNKNYKRILPDDIFLICYTSGTTNNPKGVMIKSRSLLLAANYAYNIGYHLTEEDIRLSFLPLAHSMEQIQFSLNLKFGTQIGYYHGDTNKLLEDIQVLKPTYIVAVPRIYEKFYQYIIDDINKKGILFKKIFEKALAIKLHNYEKYGTLNHAFFDPIFFKKIRNLFGGKITFLMTGSAAMKNELI